MLSIRMRYVLMLVLVVGCVTDDDDDYDPRSPLPPCMRIDSGIVLMPTAGATVPPPSVDIVVRWASAPSHRTGVHLFDGAGTLYIPTEVHAPEHVITYHYVLPPSTAFTFGATEFCYDGDPTLPKTHNYKTAPLIFNTGP